MINLFYKPIEILTSLDNKHSSEMSEWELAFVCGLIKEHKPKKILEIGVAAGGTTAVVMNCCKMLGLNTEIYSVDLMENYYRDNTKKTGYLIEAAMSKMTGGGYELPSVRIYRGGIYLEFADDIGDNIDMVVLDTVHSLPGELLDFLSCFPVLHKGSIVILHDVNLNHIGKGDRAFATKCLFDTVVADKIIEDAASFERYPNIAAFVINDDTPKYIGDVFSALTITWEYIPKNEHIELYKNFFEEAYSQNMSNMFVAALELNKRTLRKKKENYRDAIADLYKLLDKVKDKKIYIYGCGKYGKALYEFLDKIDMAVESFVVSNNQNLKQEAPLEVKHLADVFNKDAVIIVALTKKYIADVTNELEKQNMPNVFFVDEKILGMIC